MALDELQSAMSTMRLGGEDEDPLHMTEDERKTVSGVHGSRLSFLMKMRSREQLDYLASPLHMTEDERKTVSGVHCCHPFMLSQTRCEPTARLSQTCCEPTARLSQTCCEPTARLSARPLHMVEDERKTVGGSPLASLYAQCIP
jgi:hypothetical protein